MNLEPSIVQQVASLPLFSDATNLDYAKVLRGSFLTKLEHRQVLFEYGKSAEFVGIVLNGALKLARINPQGNDTILYFASTGDVVGGLAMVMSKPFYPATISAIGDAKLVLVPRETYMSTWMDLPDLVQGLQKIYFKRISQLHEHKLMQRSSLVSRIASCLMQFSSKDSCFDPVKIPIPVTRREIAETVGTTVESTIRVMSHWEKNGVILSRDSGFLILRPEILSRIANDPEGQDLIL